MNKEQLVRNNPHPSPNTSQQDTLIELEIDDTPLLALDAIRTVPTSLVTPTHLVVTELTPLNGLQLMIANSASRLCRPSRRSTVQVRIAKRCTSLLGVLVGELGWRRIISPGKVATVLAD